MRPCSWLAHYAREPIEMEGGTTFYFVTRRFDAAYAHAMAAASEREVLLAGGASTVRQAFAADVIDELVLDIAPVLLGGGEALFQGVKDPGLEPVEVDPLPEGDAYHLPRGRLSAPAPGELVLIDRAGPAGPPPA
jgi:dihydrofolate reductase